MSNTHHIPDEGEFFKGYVPAEVQLAHVTVGPSTGNDVVIGDTATYVLLGCDYPIVVFDVWTQVEDAFTASVTVTLGDTTTLDRFMADTTINPAATGAILVAATGLTVPYVYAAAQDIVVDVNGATVAAGLLHVYVRYSILAD